MRNLISIAVMGLVLSGCSGASIPAPKVIETAHAQELTPQTVIIPDKPCTLVTSGGCVEAEDPGYFLVLRLGPRRAVDGGSIITYKLPYDFKLKRLDSWVGTGLGSKMETGGWFQYQKPDGHKAAFLLETDKHTDVQGEKQKEWVFTTPIALPAGTLVTVYTGAPYLPPDVNAAACDWSCAYDVRFFMYSE